jgi:ubiquinone/menaquinone biosynthesis C-methylase UbiE
MQMSLYDRRMPGASELSLDATLDALKALAEQTRLRIVAVLRHGELTVTDLTEVLGQSQPRVSRHLKLLVDAGLVSKHREGAWIFFCLVDHRDHATALDVILGPLDDRDPMLVADLDRLALVRARRSEAAHEYFEQVAPLWDEERSLHAAEDTVELAILEAVGTQPLGSVLDLGTGTGRMLHLLARRADRAFGLDSSHSMLSVARANLEAGNIQCELRQGDVYSPPLERGAFDLVVIHQVLHYLDDPARAIREAARLVAVDGRLLVVDFAQHSHEFLREAQAHRRLGFSHGQLQDWFDQAGFDCPTILDVDPPADTDGLTVTVWLAQDRRTMKEVA